MKNIVKLPVKNRSTRNHPQDEADKSASTPKQIRAKNIAVNGFICFNQALKQEDFQKASYYLSSILGLPESKCIAYVLKYNEKNKSDEGFSDKFFQLRQAILDSESNEALMLLHICFGIQGQEAIIAYNNLSRSLL